MATDSRHVEGDSCVALRLPLEGDPHGVPVVVHASVVFEHEMKGQPAHVCKAVRMRPYCCSGGSKLMIVVRKDGGHHFRHYPVEVNRTDSSTPREGNIGGCNCSEDHLIAQRLLVENIDRIEVQTWSVCKKHVAEAWSNKRACASLEKAAIYNGRRVRYDVVVRDYLTNACLKVFEVRHKSKTDPSNRPTGSVEVDASHVISQCRKSVDGQPIVLHNLFVDDRSCAVCEAEEAARMEQRAAEAAARAERDRIENERRVAEAAAFAERERVRMAEWKAGAAARAEAARVRNEALRIEKEKQEALKAEQRRVARAEEERLRALEDERRERQRIRRKEREEREEKERMAKAEKAEKERLREEKRNSFTISPTVGFSVRIGDGRPSCKEWPKTQEEVEAARRERMERVAGKKRRRTRRN